MSINNNNAPFAIGQRVVALVNFTGYLVKGNTYTVFAQYYCRGCGSWSIGFAPHNLKPRSMTHTCTCGSSLPLGEYYTADSKKFAPITEARQRIVYVAETLREAVKEVVPETLDAL